MGKYIPKFPRGQCVHIYNSYGKGGAKKGERCQRHGRMGGDRQFRCRYHRGDYYNHLKKRNEKRLAIKIKAMSKKLNELVEKSRAPAVSLQGEQKHN